MATTPSTFTPGDSLEWFTVDEAKRESYARDRTSGAVVLYSQPLHGCVRCGGDHETPLIYTPLRNPLDRFTFWAMCPDLGQPVFLGFAGDVQEYPCPYCDGTGVKKVGQPPDGPESH